MGAVSRLGIVQESVCAGTVDPEPESVALDASGNDSGDGVGLVEGMDKAA